MSVFAPEDSVLDTFTERRQVVLPRVNLLPPEVAERKSFRRLQAGLGGVVLLAVGAVGLLYMQASSGESSAHAALQSAQAQGVVLQHKVAQLSNVTATRQQYEATQAALAKVMGQEVRWSRYLNDLSITLPANVWITNLSITEGASSSPSGTSTTAGISPSSGLGQITISGAAFSFNDVAVWLETLAKEKGYADPYLTQGQRTTIGGRDVITFTSTVNLSSGVLSNRYSAQAGN